MVANANDVLEEALKPGHEGIPPALFQKCKGIVVRLQVCCEL